MIEVIWEYQVKADYIAEFEKVYAPDGKWTELFKKGKGFVQTRLIRHPDHPNLFLTIDRWESMKDYKAFLSQWKEEYEKLDRQCEGLTEHESCLGTIGAGFNEEE
jgi:heme-degrading monooxygenase HmoA